jgi:hypothetical protein
LLHHEAGRGHDRAHHHLVPHLHWSTCIEGLLLLLLLLVLLLVRALLVLLLVLVVVHRTR